MVTLKIYGVDFEHTWKKPVNFGLFGRGFALNPDRLRRGFDLCLGALSPSLELLAEASGRLWYPGNTALFSKVLHE